VMQTVRGVFENIGVVQESMETIARPHAVVDAPDAKPLRITHGEIRFEHVTFHYGREDGIIEDLSFVIAAGERVGIVGASGAGTTLRAGAFSSTGRTSRMSRRIRCASRSRW